MKGRDYEKETALLIAALLCGFMLLNLLFN
jgi:hypothetical protein